MKKTCSLRTWNWWKMNPPQDEALRYLIDASKALGRLPTTEEAWTYENRSIMSQAINHYGNYEEAIGVVAALIYANPQMKHPRDLSWMKNPPVGQERKALEKQYFEGYKRNLAEVEVAPSPTRLLEERQARRANARKEDIVVLDKIEHLPGPRCFAKAETQQVKPMQDVERVRTTESIDPVEKPEASAPYSQSSEDVMRKCLHEDSAPMVRRALIALEKLVKHYRAIPTQLQADLYHRYHEKEGAVSFDSLVDALGPASGWRCLVDPAILREVGISGQ